MKQVLQQFGTRMARGAVKVAKVLGGKRPARRFTSLGLIYILLLQPLLSLPLHAETAGATAPEVTKFEPVDTTDMVNLASGDFTYNIPILNVPGPEGGYPLSLNYHSGVRHGEEASWVGLGWNLQPGSISRGVRGYPDDFKGDQDGIVRNIKSYDSIHEELGFAVPIYNSGFFFNFGMEHTNYVGYGGYVGLSYGPGAGTAGVGVGGTVGITPEGESYVSVNVGYQFAGGVSVGIQATTRGNGSFGANIGFSGKESGVGGGLSVTTDGHSTQVGLQIQTSQGISFSANSSGGVGAGFSAGHGSPTASASFSSYSGGGVQSRSYTIPSDLSSYWHIPGGMYTKTVSWIDKDEYEKPYGYWWHHIHDDGGFRISEWALENNPGDIWRDDKRHALATGLNYSPSYDNYMVTAQGTGGGIRPIRLSDRVYRPLRSADEWKEANEDPYLTATEAEKLPRFVFLNDNSEIMPGGDYLGISGTENSETDPGRLGEDGAFRKAVNGWLSAADPVSAANLDASPETKLPVALGRQFRPGARQVDVGLDGAAVRFSQFTIREVDGRRYEYGQPIYNWWSTSESTNSRPLQGQWYSSKVTINRPYAYAWYLTKITYPDWVSQDGSSEPREGDQGGWVKIAYLTAASDYRWSSSVDGQTNDGPINRIYQVGIKKAGMMYLKENGAKEIVYPHTIETATHLALFSTSPREDGKSIGEIENQNYSLSFDSNTGNGEISFVTPLVPGVDRSPVFSSDLKIRCRYLDFDDDGRVVEKELPYFEETSPETDDFYDHGFPGFPRLSWIFGKNTVGETKTCPEFRDGNNENPIIYRATTSTGKFFIDNPRVDQLDLHQDTISVVINGIPFLIDKNNIIREYVEVINCDLRSISYENSGGPELVYFGSFNVPKVVGHSYKYKLKFNIDNQFWSSIRRLGNGISFKDYKDKWENLRIEADLHGGKVKVAPSGVRKLDDIYLFEKTSKTLVKQVHFEYSYRLAPGTINSNATASDSPVGRPKGKLTLESVQVFGRDGGARGTDGRLLPASSQAEYGIPPYRFIYDEKLNLDLGPNGGKQCFDRWNSHKSDGSDWNHRDCRPEDQAAWHMTGIILPTGGTLRIQYEAKDYARVQDRFPLNPAANGKGQVGHYSVDVAGWLQRAGLSDWPKNGAEQQALARTFLELCDPNGEADIPQTKQQAPYNQPPPLKAAPNPRDLAAYYIQKETSSSLSFKTLMDRAKAPSSSTNKAGLGISLPKTLDTNGYVDARKAMLPMASDPLAADQGVGALGMVCLEFQFHTKGKPSKPLSVKPLREMDGSEAAGEEADRLDMVNMSVIALMAPGGDPVAGSANPNRARLSVVDPEFFPPMRKPDSVYATWTFPSNKVGGGARVKRITSWDGHRAFNTSYTYTDYVNGGWVSSGVAASEPPPFSFADRDDRVIQTENGGWNNESGGGIIHSRVTVRHGWSETPQPAGWNSDPFSTTSPNEVVLGESVFRFITPADLPHKQRTVEALTTVAGTSNTNGVTLTEVFNMGAWWGKLLWREDRDAKGNVLSRVENDYSQLKPYLQFFSKGAPLGIAGRDMDFESTANGWKKAEISGRSDMTYTWASSDLPKVLKGAPGWDEWAQIRGQLLSDTMDGKKFPDSAMEDGFLNTTVGITIWQSYDASPAWQSAVHVVREIGIPPVAKETRHFVGNITNPPENLKESYGMPMRSRPRPSKIERPQVWERRTGQPLETWTQGKTGSDGADWIITRTWPAYWKYQGMSDKGLLSQIFQTTTSRRSALGVETYLNSKVETWMQPFAPDGGWFKGGDFVWNGKRDESGLLAPIPFPDPNWRTLNPNLDVVGGYQQYRSQNWLFAGAVTQYDGFGHALEAVDGDGTWGCSKYGYGPEVLTKNVASTTGILPVAKFSNARNQETLYWDFENVRNNTWQGQAIQGQLNTSFDPIERMDVAYTGERSFQGTLTVPVPGNSTAVTSYELRFYVKAKNEAEAKASFQGTSGAVLQVVPASNAPAQSPRWWLVRAKVNPSSSVSLCTPAGGYFDDVSVFPWRRNGAPASVSHFSYDRTLGLVTSITGSNGRTQRYKYDRLGRLAATYDGYGNPSTATRYRQVEFQNPALVH